jgi:hypothetical protein
LRLEILEYIARFWDLLGELEMLYLERSERTRLLRCPASSFSLQYRNNMCGSQCCPCIDRMGASPCDVVHSEHGSILCRVQILFNGSMIATQHLCDSIAYASIMYPTPLMSSNSTSVPTVTSTVSPGCPSRFPDPTSNGSMPTGNLVAQDIQNHV